MTYDFCVVNGIRLSDFVGVLLIGWMIDIGGGKLKSDGMGPSGAYLWVFLSLLLNENLDSTGTRGVAPIPVSASGIPVIDFISRKICSASHVLGAASHSIGPAGIGARNVPLALLTLLLMLLVPFGIELLKRSVGCCCCCVGMEEDEEEEDDGWLPRELGLYGLIMLLLPVLLRSLFNPSPIIVLEDKDGAPKELLGSCCGGSNVGSILGRDVEYDARPLYGGGCWLRLGGRDDALLECDIGGTWFVVET